MDISMIVALLIWSLVDFYAAKALRDKNEGFEVEPILYALGALLLGGIWPLLYLGTKFVLWKNRKNN